MNTSSAHCAASCTSDPERFTLSLHIVLAAQKVLNTFSALTFERLTCAKVRFLALSLIGLSWYHLLHLKVAATTVPEKKKKKKKERKKPLYYTKRKESRQKDQIK